MNLQHFKYLFLFSLLIVGNLGFGQEIKKDSNITYTFINLPTEKHLIKIELRYKDEIVEKAETNSFSFKLKNSSIQKDSLVLYCFYFEYNKIRGLAKGWKIGKTFDLKINSKIIDWEKPIMFSYESSNITIQDSIPDLPINNCPGMIINTGGTPASEGGGVVGEETKEEEW